MKEDMKNEIQEKLTRVRADLLAFLRDLDDEEWKTAVQTGDAGWTIADVVRHLVNAESGMTGLIEQFKMGKDPVPPDFDRERYNKSRVKKTQNVTPDQLVALMEENRNKLFEVIESLEPEDWQKKGRHASLRILTVEEVCHVIADHENQHFNEMKKALIHNNEK